MKDKGADIAILRTMGASSGAVMRVFLLAGSAIGVAGTAAGLAIGLAVARNVEDIRRFFQDLTGVDPFDAKLYWLDALPSVVDPAQVAMVVGLALSLSFLATLYPSWRAARLDPVEGLRHG